MEMIFGALAGLAWGALWGFLNTRILKRSIEKNNNQAMLAANLIRTLVDLASLAAVFLLRGILPFRYEAMLIGTAVSLSLVSIVFAYRYGRQ